MYDNLASNYTFPVFADWTSQRRFCGFVRPMV